jgi:hypothetical protein
MKTLMTAAALAALIAASPALAEDMTKQPDAAAPQTQMAPDQNGASTTAPAPAATDTMQPAGVDATKATDRVTDAQPSPAYLNEQNEGQWLASKLIGTSVVNPAGESLGDINDVIVDGQGPVEGVIIGVGGFLGMGEKNVAVAFDRIERSTDENGNSKFVLNATKEEIDKAPPFVTLAEKQREQAPSATGSIEPAPAPERPAQQ